MQPEPVSAETMKVRWNSTLSFAALASSSSVSGFTRSTLFRISIFGWHRGRDLVEHRIGVALDAALGIDQHQDDIGVLGAAPGGRHHRRVEPAPRLEDARRVDEDDLRIVVRGDAAHDGARRLHLVGDDRHFRADQLVHQRRLAGVRRADQRDEAGASGARARLGGFVGRHAAPSFDRPHAFAHQESGGRRLLGRAAANCRALGRLEAVNLHATR